MAGVNKVIIIGNLGRDPEVRYAQTGTAVCTLSIAVTERRKDGDAWKDATEWFRVKCFGKTAENAGQYLQKGRQVYVEGRLETSKYQDKDGQERTSVDVIAASVVFIGGNVGAPAPGNNDRPTSRPSSTTASGRNQAPDPDPNNGAETDGLDDLPF